jgi:hypothetical protein
MRSVDRDVEESKGKRLATETQSHGENTQCLCVSVAKNLKNTLNLN